MDIATHNRASFIHVKKEAKFSSRWLGKECLIYVRVGLHFMRIQWLMGLVAIFLFAFSRSLSRLGLLLCSISVCLQYCFGIINISYHSNRQIAIQLANQTTNETRTKERNTFVKPFITINAKDTLWGTSFLLYETSINCKKLQILIDLLDGQIVSRLPVLRGENFKVDSSVWFLIVFLLQLVRVSSSISIRNGGGGSLSPLFCIYSF